MAEHGNEAAREAGRTLDRVRIESILSVALQMESDMAAYYRSVAQEQTCEPSRQALNRLAELEDEHYQDFVRLLDELSASNPSADFRIPPYLARVLEDHNRNQFRRYQDPLARSRRPAEIIQTAMELEKESILFYLGFHPLLNRAEASHTVYRIIQEELSHIAVLAENPFF